MGGGRGPDDDDDAGDGLDGEEEAAGALRWKGLCIGMLSGMWPVIVEGCSR